MIGALRRILSGAVEVLMATYQAWRADRTMRLGAGLAYYGHLLAGGGAVIPG